MTNIRYVSYHSQAGLTTVRSYQIWINQETDNREDSLNLVNDGSLGDDQPPGHRTCGTPRREMGQVLGGVM